MNYPKLSAVLVTALVAVFVQEHVEAAAVNNRPVIGLLAQRTPNETMKYGNEYVMSEYVKYLEMGGAQVVIVKGEQPRDYYVKMFEQVNGILLPGGGVDLMTSPFARSSRILYDLAIHANDKGDYFPIWGTCQGFEMLTVLTAKKNFLEHVDAENMSIPLKLVPAYRKSRLLGKAPKEIIQYLTHEKIAANFHEWGLTSKTYLKNNVFNKFYRAISVNVGRKGREYISTMEAFHYPFYGVQWHPEKNIFTRRLDQDLTHSAHAVRVSQYFANFFVDEARKSLHRFPSNEKLSHSVIENHDRVFIPKHYIEDFFYNVNITNS